ncbi:hypothetical protein DDP54_10875 [Cellulomonas sp. WB94]|uniref:hypothetical protein n=1 Tax=Cellulomonas sp. WB94 TaxID=2173174 RepID=UPI000D56B969|nr:hypothetical protein [Cellulomonas sp. WB94]PVU83417.1 hypothetical protein DDP54_10875 [Cellulomonas sp. WB94]
MNKKFRTAAGVGLGMFAVLALAGPAAAADPATGCVREDSGYAAPGVTCVLPTPAPRSDVLGAEPNVTVVRADVLSATGSNVEPVLWLAGGLVVVGAGVLGGIAVARRRHTA